jgi:hypothetical protein
MSDWGHYQTGPNTGPAQPEVTQAMMEVFNWLKREGHLIRSPGQPKGDWFTISRSGQRLDAEFFPSLLTIVLLQEACYQFGRFLITFTIRRVST